MRLLTPRGCTLILLQEPKESRNSRSGMEKKYMKRSCSVCMTLIMYSPNKETSEQCAVDGVPSEKLKSTAPLQPERERMTQ